MASKGPRSKLDHETRARRQKALEAPREPCRPKTHWDHVLEEMIWLSKDFEAERKWKLALAKKVASRASRGMLDQATRGEKRMKEEEQRMRKIALNISKDVKKFWTKVEKLVLYKHQLELDDKKKKALDKQLEYLLGQTERYSTMLAENLMGASNACPSEEPSVPEKTSVIKMKDSNRKMLNSPEALAGSESDTEIKTHGKEGYELSTKPNSYSLVEISTDLNCLELEKHNDDADESLELLAEAKSYVEIETNEMEADDDYEILSEDELEDDEQTIEEDDALITEAERQEELAALHNEVDLPLEEILKRYSVSEVNGESYPDGHTDAIDGPDDIVPDEDPGVHPVSKAKASCSVEILKHHHGKSNGILESDCQLPEVELDQRQKESDCVINSDLVSMDYDFGDDQADVEFAVSAFEEKDDETTLEEEEEMEKEESRDPEDEIALLQKESEVPLEELLARYKKDFTSSGSPDDDSDYPSAESEVEGSPVEQMLEQGQQDVLIAEGNIADQGKLVLPSSGEAVVSRQESEPEEESARDARIADAAAAARSAQPTGNTFSTTNVQTKYPFLMKHSLREYQHIGLDWLVTMYEKRLNGILADEMGLGKTIMTIALLAHLACEKGIWGPHLIVVPTSVMLNWETEFLKWCPAFKILTYFGSAKERKYKRQGWMKPNSFHVCITTYRLVIQDAKAFKRKKWKYLILDEAHLIKNWKSQRWQTLLNFNSKRRILLTGTPLQNDLMELWSLMHFLMPHIFQSHQEFKDWFCNPISGMVEGQEKVNKEVVDRLHNVLRPFILRRLKRDVEKQLPMKHEHVIYCRLSKRQRNLYEDFIANSETQATLASANFIGMLNVIMQLRKVCNHPDLFEGRPIVSSFDMEGLEMQLSSNLCSVLSQHPFSFPDVTGLGFVLTHLDFSMTSWQSDEIQSIATPARLIEFRGTPNSLEFVRPGFKSGKKGFGTNIFAKIQKAIFEERLNEANKRATAIAWWNSLRCRKKPVYSTTLRELLTIKHPVCDIQRYKENPVSYEYSSKLADVVLSPVERFQKMLDQVEAFMFAIPAARAPSPACWCCKSGTSVFLDPVYKEKCSEILLPLLTPIRPAIVRRQLYFPDRRLIQFDCGKLQQLAILLRRLKSEGHRALIFTQMTKMLDILEAFINLYGYTYMRLDGSTQPEERQTLMQRFNTNPKIFLFILSTRSGGVGINLVGADTVIFYDSDWNPAMDQQAQDRCHRIGQTREVHIYRLVSESTIEENILKKAKQKRALDDLVIQSGGYNTEFFKKLDPLELFSGHKVAPVKNMELEKKQEELEVNVSNADIEAALRNAEDEADYMALKKVEQEEAVDNQEFTEEAIGKLEDEDLGNEDVTKADESVDQDVLLTSLNKDNVASASGIDLDEEKALTLACNEDDVDMIADVKQMAAAAAAAGQEVLSFENQLRPIDRYAMRFLELWDPIIDRNAIENQVQFEEREWELERLEKLKEDMEAEVDDDDEPLVYEKWDAEFATQAYHQQVEALAQHQLMEELENKAKEIEHEDANGHPIRSLASSGGKMKKKKKKAKKGKFKSLKKESLSSAQKALQEEGLMQYLSSDHEDIYLERTPGSDVGANCFMLQKKRKKDETSVEFGKERIMKIKFKKAKKTALVTIIPPAEPNLLGVSHDEIKDSRAAEEWGADLELKPARGRMGGKISISTMPMKRIYTIRPKKLKKKGNMWSSDCFPPPDSWLPQEDAVLCALVHEYGPNWSLVSDTLYGMTAGGLYRGRFRHPVLCSERFRELVQIYVHAVADSLNIEKASIAGPTKGQLRVTEDNIRVLLDASMEQPDHELLLQRHFTALLTSVWRMTSSLDRNRNHFVSSNKLYPSIRLFGTSVNPNAQNSTRGQSKKFFDLNHVNVITTALHDAGKVGSDDAASKQMEEDPPTIDKLDVVVEFGRESGENGGSPVDFPSIVSLSVPDFASPLVNIPSDQNQLRLSQHLPESRYRASSSACLDGVLGWASSAFPVIEPRSRSSLKSPSTGKHKLGVGESSRQSKLKLRKVAGELSYSLVPFGETLFHPPSVSPSKPLSGSNSNTPPILDCSFEDLFKDIPDGLDEESSLTSNIPEMVPHCYNPSFISGLDDCSLLELSDIG